MDWTNNCCMKNNCILKIAIAAAIHVIKFKPPEYATSKHYALHLKQIFLSDKKYQEGIFETEKETLIKDLLRIPAIDQTKISQDFQPESGHNKEHSSNDEHIIENTCDDPLRVKSNTEFIEALVHIKNITNSKNSIDLGKFQTILSLVSQNVTENSKTRLEKRKEKLLPSTHRKMLSIDPTDCFQSLFAKFSLKSSDICEEIPSQEWHESQDSGYTSLEPVRNTFKNSYVLSSDINQVLRKNKSDLILTKSVKVVLDSLTKTINLKTVEGDFWRSGSTLETSVKSIVKLVDCESIHEERSNFRDICSTFTKSLLNTASSVDDDTFSVRCTVIRELSESPYICRSNISHLLQQISTIKESILKNINSVGEDYYKMCSIDMVEEESLFILYKLLKELLSLYVRRKNNSLRLRTARNSKPVNVYAAWKDTAEEDDSDLTERSLVLKWRTCLEELNTVFSEYLTNIMFFNFECLSLLEEYIPLTDALDKG